MSCCYHFVSIPPNDSRDCFTTQTTDNQTTDDRRQTVDETKCFEVMLKTTCIPSVPTVSGFVVNFTFQIKLANCKILHVDSSVNKNHEHVYPLKSITFCT